MTDHDKGVTEPLDLVLAREIKNLDPEMRPERNLWAGIERQIQDYPQRQKRGSLNWIPYGVAASLILAASALLLNVAQLTGAQPSFVSTDQSIDMMQAEYVQVRNPMVQKFTETNKSLDEKTLNDLYRNLEILEQARRDIEAQVRQNPENRRLVEMLMHIHEQELSLLKQDFSRPGQFM
ncbi:MAG: hypothetical protein CMQ20_06305 [Gammaproteobacteria bacterium]|jgi:hypothetical protein|nr:hypothetical protein [Gammaproteobacteria bacterium]|tara:strand:- start:109 stop:645 length:537 start_codon:yes stop_codon:yes gene_type:complete